MQFILGQECKKCFNIKKSLNNFNIKNWMRIEMHYCDENRCLYVIGKSKTI